MRCPGAAASGRSVPVASFSRLCWTDTPSGLRPHYTQTGAPPRRWQCRRSIANPWPRHCPGKAGRATGKSHRSWLCWPPGRTIAAPHARQCISCFRGPRRSIFCLSSYLLPYSFLSGCSLHSLQHGFHGGKGLRADRMLHFAGIVGRNFWVDA